MPGARTDNHHIALAIEGGGMVSVNAGGMVSALESLGLRDAFDSVHGSSAGAGCGAYFVSRNALSGARTLYDRLDLKQFIDINRMFRGKPIVDTQYLIDEAMLKDHPLDAEKVISSDIPLYISSTDIDSGRTKVDCEFRDKKHFWEVLKGSMSLPFVAGPAITLDGCRLLDGGLVEQFGLGSAIDVGATHILVLFTRREVRLKRALTPAKTWLQSLFLQLMYGGKTGAVYRNRLPKIHADIDCILSGYAPTGAEIGYVTLAPEVEDLQRLTTEPARLSKASQESFDYLVSSVRLALSESNLP
jgi:predicted patatin/cPLA2 family phospholipase